MNKPASENSRNAVLKVSARNIERKESSLIKQHFLRLKEKEAYHLLSTAILTAFSIPETHIYYDGHNIFMLTEILELLKSNVVSNDTVERLVNIDAPERFPLLIFKLISIPNVFYKLRENESFEVLSLINQFMLIIKKTTV